MESSESQVEIYSSERSLFELIIMIIIIIMLPR